MGVAEERLLAEVSRAIPALPSASAAAARRAFVQERHADMVPDRFDPVSWDLLERQLLSVDAGEQARPLRATLSDRQISALLRRRCDPLTLTLTSCRNVLPPSTPWDRVASALSDGDRPLLAGLLIAQPNVPAPLREELLRRGLPSQELLRLLRLAGPGLRAERLAGVVMSWAREEWSAFHTWSGRSALRRSLRSHPQLHLRLLAAAARTREGATALPLLLEAICEPPGPAPAHLQALDRLLLPGVGSTEDLGAAVCTHLLPGVLAAAESNADMLRWLVRWAGGQDDVTVAPLPDPFRARRRVPKEVLIQMAADRLSGRPILPLPDGGRRSLVLPLPARLGRMPRPLLAALSALELRRTHPSLRRLSDLALAARQDPVTAASLAFTYEHHAGEPLAVAAGRSTLAQLTPLGADPGRWRLLLRILRVGGLPSSGGLQQAVRVVSALDS